MLWDAWNVLSSTWQEQYNGQRGFAYCARVVFLKRWLVAHVLIHLTRQQTLTSSSRTIVVPHGLTPQAHAILLKVTVARAQHLKSVSTISTQDPYVRAKLLVDGYHVRALILQKKGLYLTGFFN